jgi:hypothetical protein
VYRDLTFEEFENIECAATSINTLTFADFTDFFDDDEVLDVWQLFTQDQTGYFFFLSFFFFVLCVFSKKNSTYSTAILDKTIIVNGVVDIYNRHRNLAYTLQDRNDIAKVVRKLLDCLFWAVLFSFDV